MGARNKSRNRGRSRRLGLYTRGNTACPICLVGFTRGQAASGKAVTLEHVPIKALGGRPRCLTCKSCKSIAGRGIDQAAAMTAQDRFGVTVDILGKRDTFMLSLEGKALTRPFGGYSIQDIRDWENSGSRKFTMSIRIPNSGAVASSALKSAYLALFSLLGQHGGYAYAQGGAATPIRQRIMTPPKHGALDEYVIKAPGDVTLNDISLVNKPLPCWVLKIASHLVLLPLTNDGPGNSPLKDLGRVGQGCPIVLSGRASWSFSDFGAFDTAPVHLVGPIRGAGVETGESLLGLRIGGVMPNSRSLEGACIFHAGEYATLLFPRRARTQ